MCSIQVKLTLFRIYCSPMYTAQLWWSYKKSSMSKLIVSYHNIFKLFIGVSKFESTSTLCMVTDTQVSSGVSGVVRLSSVILCIDSCSGLNQHLMTLSKHFLPQV